MSNFQENSRKECIFKCEISELAKAASIYLNNKQLDELEIHNNLLASWGRKINLTAIQRSGELLRRHFLESLIAGHLLLTYGASGALMDLGSGNGFPGVPMGVLCRNARPLVLVESSQKRAAFLRALLRELRWDQALVDVRRVTGDSNLLDLRCRLFTSRGVNVGKLVQAGLPFLEAGGFCVLFGSVRNLELEAGPLPECLLLKEVVPLPGRQTGILLLQRY